MSRILAGCFVLAITACDSSAPFGFTDPHWSLQGVVEDSTIRVLMTSSGSEVPGEVVLMIWGNDEWFAGLEETARSECVSGAHPDADEIRCFTAVVSTVANPGATYTIRGIADGNELEGSTVIPAVPNWTIPSSRIEVDTVAAFGRPEPAARIALVRDDSSTYWMDLSLSVATVFEGGLARSPDCDVTAFAGLPLRAPQDEALLAIQAFQCVQSWDSAHASVVVRRFDANLGDYFAAVQSGASDVASFGLEGAWGYWGSISSSTIDVVLLPAGS